MAELSFEGRLERLFAETPPMRDADLFTLRVLGRVDRGWTARRFLIGAMGVTGGLAASIQILGAGVLGQIRAYGVASDAFINEHVARASILPAGVTVDGQVIWMTVALAVTAAGLGLARVIREI
jgi:hypothetical protein